MEGRKPGITAAPQQALHQKNNAHIEVGVQAFVAPIPPLTPDNSPQSEHHFSASLKGGVRKQKNNKTSFRPMSRNLYDESHSPDSGSTAGMTDVSFNRPYRVLEMNRFRWVYRQDVRRAALSICPRRDGSRAMQEQLPRERMAACAPKSVHFQVTESHTMGLPFSWLILLGKQKN